MKIILTAVQVALLMFFMQNSMAASKAKADPILKWVGEYESISGNCGSLSVRELKFSWGACRDVGMDRVAVSAAEFTIKVDPAAQCGWAGMIVSLGKETEAPIKSQRPLVRITAYETLEDYKKKNELMHCTYFVGFEDKK